MTGRTKTSPTVKPVPVRSLKKALDILDLIIEADLHEVDASLAGLARCMGMPSNSVHNLLKKRPRADMPGFQVMPD